MITDLRVGDYIEKSELDTEQKYNDVVEVFKSHGFTGYKTVNDYHSAMNDAFPLIFIKDGRFMLCGYGAEIQRKLTYNEIMSLKKVDVDNCNIDKVVSDECFREDSTAKEMLKSAKAVLAMESLGHEWDEEKGRWFRKEYF